MPTVIFPQRGGYNTSQLVFVSSASDLPAAAGGVRTLGDNVTYFFTGTVDLSGDRLVCGNNTTILGGSSENCRIKSTGLSGAALISSAYSLPIRNISIEAETALDLDATGNPTAALDWLGVNIVDTPTVGTIKNYNNTILSLCAFLNSSGLTFDGTTGTVGIEQSLFDASTGGTLITLPSTLSITRRFRISYSALIVTAGETGINASTSATLPIEGYILDTVNFSGGGTYTTGVGFSDDKVRWTSCVNVTNSVAVINIYMFNNATATTVPTLSQHYRILGTASVASNLQRFTFESDTNAAVYSSSVPRRCKAQCSFTLTANNNNIVGVYIAVCPNGQELDPDSDVIEESEVYVTASGTRPDSSFVQAIVNLSQGDRVYMVLHNTTSTAAVTVQSYNLVVEQAVS